jgi:3-phosphoshikimate 1-carboxyvinyltransferase
MIVKVSPSVARGSVKAPSSKSYAHRLLIASALCDGKSVINNIDINDDINATISCLEKIGAEFIFDENSVTVYGISPERKLSSQTFFCNESGSTLRFLIPLSLLYCNESVFSGSQRLLERPQSVYESVLGDIGCSIHHEEKSLVVKGEMKSGTFNLRGDVSSQFITGLLFTLPLLEDDSEIILTTPLQSAPYIDITIEALKTFGVEISSTENGWFVKGKQKYTPCTTVCEGDWSNSAFLDCFNLSGGSVNVEGLNSDSVQGDMAYKDFFCGLKGDEPCFDISQCPDLGPVLIACAACSGGALIKGTNRLKIKESDRGAAMAEELRKFGVNLELYDDYIKVPCVQLSKPAQALNCHNDHRIMMSLTFLSSITGGEIHGAQCVNKSYPHYLDDIKKLGIIFEITR